MAPPDYQRVVDDIAAKIAAGILKPGDRLPTIRVMADEYDTSQTTVKTALMLLRQRGLTDGQQGRATFIADPLPKDAGA